MGDTNVQLPGPCGLFVSGFSLEAKAQFEALLEDVGVSSPAIVYCTASMLSGTLEEALTVASDEAPAEKDKLPPVIVFSGMNFQEVQFFMKDYHKTGLARPLFATTTEHNLLFSVKELILHLLEERKELIEQQRTKHS